MPDRITMLDALRQLAGPDGMGPTSTEMDEHGPYVASQYAMQFGSWNAAVRAAGLEPRNPSHGGASTAAILAAIRAVADQLGHVPTYSEMKEHGDIHPKTAASRFGGSFAEAVRAAGFDPRHPPEVSTAQLLADIRRLAEDGDPPTRTDMTENGKYGATTCESRFGSWNEALKAAGCQVRKRIQPDALTDEELLGELRRLAETIGQPPTGGDIETHGEYPSSWYYSRFGSLRAARKQAGLPPGGGTEPMACPTCGEPFQQLATHWQTYPSHRPAITSRQHEVLAGVLLGDATLYRNRDPPALGVWNVRRRYLTALAETLWPLCTPVAHHQSGQAAAQAMEAQGKIEDANAVDYDDIYRLYIRGHPDLERYRRWYADGIKRFPASLELTPTMLRHWYCCDGGLSFGATVDIATARIKATTQADRLGFLKRLFDQIGIDVTLSGETISFDRAATDALFAYIGDHPVPGFEYKWERDSWSQYKTKKERKDPGTGDAGYDDADLDWY